MKARPTVPGIALLGMLAIGACWSCARDKSIYAPNFSELRFQQLRTGMSEAEVVKLLGSPLHEQVTDEPETWFFKEQPPGGMLSINYPAAEINSVAFDDDLRVVKRRGEFTLQVRPGMTADTVHGLLGPPARRVPARRKRFDYSAPGQSGLYRARIVTFGRDGTVAEIVAYEMHD